jgi:antirestriction protein ArdC
MTQKEKRDVYQEVTDKILSALEQGDIPWQKPWVNLNERPANLISKKPYKGINVFLLGMAPYGSRWWLTFKQAKAKGGSVKKGEKSTMIVFWQMSPNKDYDPKNPNKGPKVFPFLRFHNVFNVEQCEGIDYPKSEPIAEFNPVERAEQIIEQMPQAPPIRHGGDRAFYSPSKDHVQLPNREQFKDAEHYYATMFHELSHSTGHKDRLDRPELTKLAAFGDHEYSKEELVAEMSAGMLCGVSGISNRVINNQAAYIKGWIEKLQNDKKLLVSAAGKAQKSADFILDEAT